MREDVFITQDDGVVRRIGYTKDGAFYTTKKRSKHYHRSIGGWGIDSRALEQMMLEGVKEVVIYDIENGVRYKAPIQKFNSDGKFLNHKPFGKQQFLPEEHWEVI